MKLGLDEYINLDSPFHRWEARYKLIGLITLIFAFSFVRDLRMLLAMVGVTIVIYVISKLPASFILSRLRFPSFFLLALVLTLPFLSGQTAVLSIGPLDMHREGLLSVLLITTRFISILTIALVLFATTPLLTTIKAMRALGLPGIMADMALLALRYIQEIGQDLKKMQTSMRLRGFRKRRLSIYGLRTLAWLGGSILVHSYERSEWVYKAMILRGYGHAPHPRAEFQAYHRDMVTLGIILMIAAGFITGDILLGHETVALLQ